MKIKLLSFIIFATIFCSSQVKNDSIVNANYNEATKSIKEKNPLKASLYSALLPGAGQLYNEKKWKAPIVLGIVGTGVGFTAYYNGLYKKYRRIYLSKLEGKTTVGYENLSAEQLAVYQDEQKRNRDYAIVITGIAYILNILDATVDAHLFTNKNDPDLTLAPVVLQSEYMSHPLLGFNINLKF